MNYLLLKKHEISLLIIKHTAKKFNIQLEECPTQITINPNIYWNDSESKIGFIQNILSLIKKGYIKHSGLTEKQAVIELGRYFNLKIENGHFQSLRRSVLDSNSDYKPPIFSIIQEGYGILEKEIIDKDNKRQKNNSSNI